MTRICSKSVLRAGMRIAATGCLLSVLGGVCGFSAELSSKAPEVILRIIPDSAPYYQDVYYVLSVSGPGAADIAWPDYPEHLDGLLIETLSASEVPPALQLAPETPVKVYRLTALKPGIWKLPARTLRLREDGQEEGGLPVPAILYEALPLPEGTVPGIDALADPASLAALLPRRHLGWLGLIGIATAAMLTVLMWYYRKAARKSAPATSPLPPWETALRWLEDLRRRNWPMLGKVELYYVDLSAILRYYIQDRFGVNAPEMTTQECVEALASSGLDSPSVEALKGLLRHCDQVKFAGLLPGVPEMEARLEAAAAFIRQTIPAPGTQPAVASRPEREGV